MKMRQSIVLFWLLAGVFLTSEGQDVSVTAAFDSTRIYIGDQINYTITVDQPADLVLQLPLLKDTLCKNIEILSGPVLDSITIGNERLKVTSIYLITSFDSGLYQAPPTFAEIKNESGIKRFYSGYSPLEVMRVKIAPADTSANIFDIIKPYRAPVTVGEILPWVVIAALAAAAIWVVIRLLRRFKRQNKVPETIINPEPAHVIALRDLNKLKDEQLWQKGEVKLYYSKLTEILRQYLENRYGVYSLELTTSETLEALVKTGFKKDDLYSNLKTILNGSDLVKFAKYKPEHAENDTHFQSSWAFVEATMVKEEPNEKKS